MDRSVNTEFAEISFKFTQCKKLKSFLNFISERITRFGRCTTKQWNEAQWGSEFGRGCSDRTIRNYTSYLAKVGIIEVVRTGRALIKRLTEKGKMFLKWMKKKVSDHFSDQVSDQHSIYKIREGDKAGKGFLSRFKRTNSKKGAHFDHISQDELRRRAKQRELETKKYIENMYL